MKIDLLVPLMTLGMVGVVSSVLANLLLTMLKSTGLRRAIAALCAGCSVRRLMLWVSRLTVALALLLIPLRVTVLLAWWRITLAGWRRGRVIRARVLIVRVRHDDG